MIWSKSSTTVLGIPLSVFTVEMKVPMSQTLNLSTTLYVKNAEAMGKDLSRSRLYCMLSQVHIFLFASSWNVIVIVMTITFEWVKGW